MSGYYGKKKKGHGAAKVISFLLIVLVALGTLWFTGKLDMSFFHKANWNLTLVNSTNKIPDDWKGELTELKNDESVDSRIYPDLQKMFDACRADGLMPLVKSSYRTAEDQQQIFDEKTSEFTAAGYAEDDAREQANQWAAKPGYSEHQLGLAVDIDSEDLSVCSNEAVWEWLKAHCAEYGFILRYPSGKEDITDCSYEPWHFRYVGEDAAKTIMEQGITLEEYLKEQKK